MALRIYSTALIGFDYKTFSSSLVASLFSLPAVSDVEKDMSKCEIPFSKTVARCFGILISILTMSFFSECGQI